MFHVKQCALSGGIIGVVAMSWVSLNSQWAIASGALKFEHKPTAADNCPYDFDQSLLVSHPNSTLIHQSSE